MPSTPSAPAAPVAPVAPTGIPKANVAVPLDTLTVAVGDAPADKLDTLTAASVTCCVASGLPVELLKPNTLPARSERLGSVRLPPASVSVRCSERVKSSLRSAATAVKRSSSVFKEAMSNGPEVGKSVVLSKAIPRVITTVLPPDAPTTVIPTEPPVPPPPLTLKLEVIRTPSTYMLRSSASKKSNGTVKLVCVTPAATV